MFSSDLTVRRRRIIAILVRKSHPNTGDTAGLRAPRPAFAYETGKTTPPPAYQQKPHTKSFLSMYFLCFDAQPHHSGGGSLSMPGIPWCPLVAPTVDAPQASASDATHLKLFLGPVGAC